MKNIKGVSLMALIITIAVTIIILSTVTISGIMVQNNATKIRIASEISYMQEIVDSYIVRSNGEYPVSNEILFNLSALDSKFLNQFEGEIKNENNISLYEIDRNLLGKSETIYGNKKDGDLDIYAMSKDTNRVYYLKGLNIEDVTYYTLTDELKKIIGYIEKEENYKKDGISFKPTTNTWTNNKINTEISVPKSYTDINVVVKQNNSNDISVSLSRQEDDNNIYVAENILNNYTIFVSYKKENMGENITQTYEVNIFDNLAPNITISEQKNIANGSTQYAYFNILSKTDNLSGIKIIKYAFEKISEEDAKEYFRTKGTIVNNDIIEIKNPAVFLTIYIEDNAGNVKIINRDISNVSYNENSYIKEGLVLNLDATNNTGSGHSMDTNVWKDLSGNKNDFTLYNYTNALDSNWLNNSIKFNGTNTYIKGINPIYREAEMTIEIVSSRIDNTNGSVISFNIEPDVKTYMSIYTTNQPQKAYEIGFSVSNNVSGVTNHSITKSFLDTEYKINEPKTIAYGKSKYEYFSCLNGENIHKESITNELGFLNNDMYLGCSSKQNNFFKGNIYSIRIYNRVLTDTEIKYNSNIDKLRFGI